MKYSDCESIERNSTEPEIKELCAAYKKTLEALFEIGIGRTSSSLATARYCLKKLGFLENSLPKREWTGLEMDKNIADLVRDL